MLFGTRLVVIVIDMPCVELSDCYSTNQIFTCKIKIHDCYEFLSEVPFCWQEKKKTSGITSLHKHFQAPSSS